jgi:hypothetical protein
VPYNPYGLAFSQPAGNYQAHLDRTGRGGEDYPLGIGSSLPAPAAGVLQTSGGSGEFACGWQGSAGLRSILRLNTAIGDVVAVVFQHQSSMGAAKAYAEGESVGRSGASANGSLTGGAAHLHIHCLTASGERRQFTRYFAVGGGPAPDPGGGTDMAPGNLHWNSTLQQLFRVVRTGDDH